MKLLYILIFLMIFFVGCKNSNKNVSVDNYEFILSKKKDTINKIRGDFLEIFFETQFNNDFLKIKVDGKNREYNITTDGSTGYADFIELGKLSTFNSIEFSINNGKRIKLKDIETNLILVNYKKDSIVWIDFTNKFKAYK
jgi:hypothetical protein